MSDPIARLKSEIGTVIARRVDGWRRADIAVGIGAARSTVSCLRAGRVDRFTLDTLVRYAHKLGYDVELRLHARSARERSGTQREGAARDTAASPGGSRAGG